MGDEQGIARELFRGIKAESVPRVVQDILNVFNADRSPGESFVEWSRRSTLGELQVKLSA